MSTNKEEPQSEPSSGFATELTRYKASGNFILKLTWFICQMNWECQLVDHKGPLWLYKWAEQG